MVDPARVGWATFTGKVPILDPGSADPREASSLFYIIDLAKVLPKKVTVGFSAATGSNKELHKLLSWEFSIEDIEETPNRTGMIVGVSVSAFVLLVSLVGILVAFQRRKQRKKRARDAINLVSINEDLERGAGPRRFSYKELASATNNFLDERKLGEGGFGAVYRGYLNEFDMMVAVKKFAGRSNQGMKEFITEVKIISGLRHRNLVQLIGWCHEKDEFLLVYEFMPNGSLDSHLFGKRAPLAWAVRYKVTLGLASALQYLHEEWEQCVVHRDIKPSNIMLDSNFNVKLGDFGLARLMDHELGPQTTGLAGTFGYMAPEYISTGRASKESDIYSYGVVTLEIVTGRKSVDPRQGKIEPETSLVERVWNLYGRGELVSAIDQKLGSDFDRMKAEWLMVVGLWCAHPNRSSRPSMKQAIQVLNFEAPLPNLPPKMPLATYEASTSSGSCSRASVTFSSSRIGR
ncbi:PREDICTED: L-type lectin-domain containing receptor kinase IX.1-like isoform X2 [Tarenaya hassleriana]|uniref:L-type lectin-domain containing receptor kinase IX.1-like isoform X2 n=1 Tax=Tarenaya hassleriana TaxID=28532 RepID=UPI00053C7FAD|nr:PREDICTED: L-type lectin-domain containing receptor kinase IX.1-like isoform X2 [Tarenaya hassleriana]XP_010519006.1 PREDICTED: L-type lectin-domain containing receptor kinase IX.1-like isoform X2 [Tarenaya hassleriana]XP_019056710.1 PREDICTED: L-type lectin-domain containing receptor kinase IX.1-like isoform X2 [Tarenaya hassleriana]